MVRRLIAAALLLLAVAATALAQSPYPPGPPPPVPALPDSQRQTTYTITGTTCACSVGFQLYGDSTDYQNWIEVWLNGVKVAYNDPAHGWSLSSPTGSFATIPRPITDAVLTFSAAQTGTVIIVGARRPRRTAEFSENQGVPARAFNQTFNDLYAIDRETWDKINDFTGRGLFFPPGNATGPMPAPATCANDLLGFDGTGLNPQCLTIAPGNGNVVGTSPSVNGHLAAWGNPTGTLLGDSGVAASNGNIFIKNGRPWADVMAWGALCGGNDDHTAYQNAANMLFTTYGGGTVFVPPCSSSTTATILIPSFVRIVGSGPWASFIQNSNTDVIILECNGCNYSSIEHFGVFGETAGSPIQPLVLITDGGTVGNGLNVNIDDAMIWGGATALSEQNTADGTISRSFIASGAAGTTALTSTGANHYIRDKFDDVTTSTKLAAYAQITSALSGVVENAFVNCDFSGTYTDSIVIADTNNEAMTSFSGGSVFSAPIDITGAKWTSFDGVEIGSTSFTAVGDVSIVGSFAFSATTISGGTRSCGGNFNITC